MSEPYHDCTVSYDFKGRRYSLNFPAQSREDAEARLRAIRTTAHVDGWPCFSYRVNSLTFPFVALWSFVRTRIWDRYNA